jgi:hypothetical protein
MNSTNSASFLLSLNQVKGNAKSIGMGNTKAKPIDDHPAYWTGKRGRNHYRYAVDGIHITCDRLGLIPKRWKWIVGDYIIEDVTNNNEHILFLNSQNEVFILKYGYEPTRVKLPWQADLIYSESCLACDFSLIFYRSKYSTQPYEYFVVCITDSTSKYPYNKMQELAKKNNLNVTKFLTDTISQYGMFTKLLYLKDQEVKYVCRDSDIIDVKLFDSDSDATSTPREEPPPSIIQSPREALLHRLNSELNEQPEPEVQEYDYQLYQSNYNIQPPYDPSNVALMENGYPHNHSIIRDSSMTRFDLNQYQNRQIPLNQSNLEINYHQQLLNDPYYSHPNLHQYYEM